MNDLPDISPERKERMMKRILEIIGRGNNVEIKRRSNGVIVVLEIKAKAYDI